MESNDDYLDKKRAEVEKQAKAVQFIDTDFGNILIEWYNAEIKRLTDRLVNDPELDESLPKTNVVKGELRAYALITTKLNLVNARGNAAQAILSANEPEPKEAPGKDGE